MRVRYGKPIKAKSLLGQSNIPFSYTAANVTFYPLTTGTFHSYAGPSVLNIKYVNRQANHKYFLFLNTDIVYSWAYFGIWDTYNTGYEGNRTAPIKDGNNYYTLISPTTSVTNGVPTFQFGVTQNLPAIANYALIIDLTEIGLDNLTAQEFYNKYNKYFPLIATGKEITIDDKAGQVSLKKLLPDEYQEVEYIEGDGGQYMPVINTLNNRAINGNLTVGYKFQATVHDRAMYFSTITCNLSSGQAYSLGYINANSYLYIRWNQMVNSNTQVVGYQVGDIIEVIRTNNVETILKTYSLFTHEDSSTLTWKGRIYKYWLKLDNEYLFNWIPCYRKSDNVIGLYDLVSGTFSTNIGTGTFLKGPNVTNTISCKVAGGSSDIYYGYNQLLQNSNFSNGTFGWYIPHNKSTYTYTNGGLMFTITTAMTNSSWGDGGYATTNNDQRINLYANHKYFITCEVYTEKSGQGSFYYGGSYDPYINVIANEWQRVSSIRTQQKDSIGNVVQWSPFYCAGMDVGTKHGIRNMILIDFTDWFGAGKEPSTVAEFKQKFTKEYYGFCSTPIKLTRYQIEALPSYGYNQLIKNGNFVDTSCWSPTYGTITTNDNICTYTITQVGTVGSNQNRINYAQSWQTNIIAQHKFLFASEIYCKYTQNLSFIVHDRSNGYRRVMSSSKKGVANSWNEFSAIMTANYDCLAANADMRIGFSSTADSAVGDKYYAKNFILVDLTDWYGEGKEPTTVEEFKQTFPNKYYAYSKKRLLNKYMINKLEN